ncbi:MAG: TonB-dependent receptor, partial [Vicinamibacteria bacterium]|nr:TonB-dependent receptor [Vicinamibacteria bacterium]
MTLISRRAAAVAAITLLALATAAGAAGTAFVSIIATGAATITLTGPDGSTLTQTTTTGDAALAPKSSGAHKISVTIGTKTVTGEVTIPESGQVRIIFNPTAPTPFESYVVALESVTVTAQRVEESLQKVPVAVTAFDNRQIEIKQVTNLQQASYGTPNLWMEKNTGTSSGSRAAIRGVGEDESFFTSDTPVGIYIDDIYIPRQTGAQFDLYELERLEVLRGPQGTLYGRNTSAGALRLVTKQPGNKFRANAEGAFGSYQRTDARGSVNIPIGEKAGALISGLIKKHDGYDTNTINQAKVNDQDVKAGRLAVRLLPSTRFNAVLSADITREGSTPGYAVGFVMQPPFLSTAPPYAPLASGFGVGKTDIYQQLDGDRNIHTLQSDLLNPINDIRQDGYSATLTYALNDHVTLKSVTAYRKMFNELLLDADGRTNNFLGTGTPEFHLYQLQNQDQFSQELQITGARDRLRYSGGVYYFREHNDQKTENLILNNLGRNNFWLVDGNTDSYAGYGSATYTASGRLSLTAGARLTHDDKDFFTRVFLPSGSQLVACANAQGVIAPGGGARACNASDPAGFTSTPVQKSRAKGWSAFTPRLAADYAFNPTSMGYISYSRGFKSGAFDGRSNTAAAILPLAPINPETIDTVEIGAKTDLAKGKARLNAAVFYNKWKDLQGTGTDPNGNFYRTTLGDVHTRGAEFEARVVPADGLEFFAQLSLLSTGYDTVTFNQAALCGNLNTGSRKLELKMAPPYSYQAGAQYSRPGAGGRFSVGGTVSGKGRFWHTSC